MAKPWDLTGDDIARWSQQHDAPFVLPDLVRRLLLATSPISSITMAAHAGVRLRGWDGVVRSSAETPFCPGGTSIWELSVEDDRSKLNDDYNKRSNEPGPLRLGETTYVAVSARRIAGGARWAAEKRSERTWRDVLLLDADDLAAWLSRATATARWFADRLHRPVDDLETLEGFLEGWSRRTRPPLPPEILLAGNDRQRIAEDVRRWARSAQRNKMPLRIHGSTWDEAAAFAAAALSLDTSPEGEQVRAGTVVARSDLAARQALRDDQAQPLLVIAAAEHPSMLTGPVILPLQGVLPANVANVVELPLVPYRRFAEILATKVRMPEVEAERIARASDGKLSALQRSLGYVELPSWAQGLAPLPLSALLLVGSFEPDNQEDREVIRVLGVDPEEVVHTCERLRLTPDSPVQREQSRSYRPAWSWRSEDDAWRSLSPQIPSTLLRAFEDVVRLVLSERDPKLDLPVEQRFAAALYGKSLRASGPLREGLVRSLVRLSLSDDALETLHGPRRGSNLAMRAVRDLLSPPWQAWASLADLLPLLAEAAPDTFLDGVEASLREGEAGIAHLLAEEASFGGGPHTGLLWALETLGWDERLMPRVAAALAVLAQFDKQPERAGGRPKDSLTSLLRVPRAQTHATKEQRVAEMARRLRDTPDVGFPLIVGEVGNRGMRLLMPAREPALLPVKKLSDEELNKRNEEDAREIYTTYLEMCLNHLGNCADRWAYFLNHIQMRPGLAEQVLGKLEAEQEKIRDEKAELWRAIRHILHRSTLDEQKPDYMERRALYNRWSHLYEHVFCPNDPALKYAWLFQPKAELPVAGIFKDWEEASRTLEEERRKAIEDVLAQPDFMQILVSIADRANDSSSLGWTLGQSTKTSLLDVALVDNSPPIPLARHVPSYLASRRYRGAGEEWFTNKLHSMLEQGRKSDVEASLLLLGQFPKIWDVAESLGDDVRDAFWRKMDHVGLDHPPEAIERAIKHLLGAGNISAALRNAEWSRQDLTGETVAAVFAALLSAPEEEVRKFTRDGSFSYTLEQLMDRLEAEPEADARYSTLLANAELVYALSSFEPKRPMRRLSQAFQSDHNQFVDLVKQMYRSTNEPVPERTEEEQKEARERAEAAYRVLESWTGFPGQGKPIQEVEEILYTWALKVLRDLVAAGRPDTGASEIAKVLARAPDAEEDGYWPCLAVRKLLELDEFPSLADALCTAHWNLRNREFRPVNAGKDDRDLAVQIREASATMRAAWPRTSVMLDDLAAMYERDAMRHAANHQESLRREGLEPEDLAPRRADPTPKRQVQKRGLVHISTIELTDFALFDHLEIKLDPRPERGQWVLVLGENGRGKSTLLRALALAFGGVNVAQAALADYTAPLIRFQRTEARCNVKSVLGDFLLSITKEDRGEIASADPPNGARPPVFGYGCRRGSALGGNAPATLASLLSDVVTLFRPSADLYPAQPWLADLKRSASSGPKEDHVYQTVIQKLCAPMPDVDRLDVVGNEVWAIAPKLGGRVPLAALSDGYLTTLGWLVDMVARWLHWAGQVGESTEGDFFERMEGLVLIDEIDLHLHPRWQRTIVKSLKDTFPRLSFIATTHNPLTLIGAEAGEIVVLRDAADKSGRIEAKQFDLPAGIRADRILTGEWFGLPYTVDYDTIALIEKHQQMLLRGVPQDDPDREALEEKLAQRYGGYADTSIDRMALTVAAELMRERRPKTVEDRRKLRDDLREKVRARLAERDRKRGGGAT